MMHGEFVFACPNDRQQLLARVRRRKLEVEGVSVLGLTMTGCMIGWQTATLRKQQKVLVGFSGLADLPARVLWVENDKIGLRFDQALSEAAFDHLSRSLRTN